MTEVLARAFVTLLIAVDPVAVMALYAGLTSHATVADCRRMALTGVVVAAIVICAFAVGGDLVLSVLGISLPAFRIAGGILLFLVAVDMVLARQTGLRSMTEQEDDEAMHRADVSVFPLAVPLIAGPATITSIILLMGETRGQLVVQGGVIFVALFVLALTLAGLLLSTRVLALIGRTGTNVVGRVFGIILAALSVQFVIDGALAVLRGA